MVTIERPLVLASASPRRRELLGFLGLAFSARAASVEEHPLPGETARLAVRRFAREKALAVAGESPPNSSPVVIGADTIVALDGEVMGKPKDAAEAEEMLRRLRGREHEALTALALVTRPNGHTFECVARTVVPMRNYSDEEIYLYVRSGDPFDKAGAYAIQNTGFRPVTDLEGCYANVMGLPLCHLTVLLRRAGVAPRENVAAMCQAKLGFNCPVYPQVLSGAVA